MKAHFYRQVLLPIKSKTLDPQIQGFLFDLSVGFRGKVSEESGMILNLATIDQSLKVTLPTQTSAPCLWDFFQDLCQDLFRAFEGQGLFRIELSDSDRRQGSYIWKKGSWFESSTESSTVTDEDGHFLPIQVQIFKELVDSERKRIQGIRVTYLIPERSVFEEGVIP